LRANRVEGEQTEKRERVDTYMQGVVVLSAKVAICFVPKIPCVS